MNYEILEGIEIPDAKDGRPRTRPEHGISIGQCVVYRNGRKDKLRIRCGISFISKSTGKRFTTRIVGDDLYVWRMQ